ncbi:hypothetical protein OE88DRAFT_1273998 [Heliocybe sulcata]|uniref:Uncharacterized protein n=1 Tax=Heliocybe sulcata TaxID=5364 RepID=A0A5C3N7E7_9AGAM|nr:hypothetical protein OE88DRAFT_1273998 [Heliocybe sulcata]
MVSEPSTWSYRVLIRRYYWHFGERNSALQRLPDLPGVFTSLSIFQCGVMSIIIDSSVISTLNMAGYRILQQLGLNLADTAPSDQNGRRAAARARKSLECNTQVL